jgi:Protein of unknown function (DUF4236)
MALNFRKSLKITKGLKVNLSKSGASLSVGGRGLTHNISKRGKKTTLSIPGSGLNYVHNHSKDPEVVKDNKSGAGSIVLSLVGLVVIALILFAIFS